MLVVHTMTNEGLAVLSEKLLWYFIFVFFSFYYKLHLNWILIFYRRWFYSAGENPAFTTAESSHTKKHSSDTGPFGDTCRAYRETVNNVKDIVRSRTWPRAELCNNHSSEFRY